MTWVRLDDGFADHPKVVAAGHLALVVHVRALCYAARHRTDGAIPTAAAPVLCVGLGPSATLIRALVENGLWDADDRGWRIHDYLEYNPSRADLEAQGEAKRAAGIKGGRASAQARAQASGQAPASPSVGRLVQAQSNPPSPSPSPPLEDQNKDSAALPLVSAEAAPPKAPRTRKAHPGEPSPEEAEAWRVWCEVIGQCAPTRPPSAANLLAIRKAIAAHDVATVCDAFRGVTLSAHHMGDAAYRQPASVLRLGDARIEGHAGRWREKRGSASAPAPYDYHDEPRDTPESEARYRAGMKANNARIMENLRQ